MLHETTTPDQINESPARTGDRFKQVLRNAFRSVRGHPWVFGAAMVTAALLVFTLTSYVHYYRVVGVKLKTGPFANASNIFASPKTIIPGAELSSSNLVTYLKRVGYSSSPENPVGAYVVRDGEIEVNPGPQSYFLRQPARIAFSGAKVQKLSDPATGAALEAYSLEPELITNLVDGNRERRRLVAFTEIPKVLVNAVVSVEDKRFFKHLGFDPLRLAKAAVIDLKEGRKEQGGSTITMQLARGLWLDPEKKWSRKLTEMTITAVLEQRLSKQEIFAFYANQVFLGRKETFSIHGFGEASRSFFNRDIAQLTLPQAALLAGMIQRPSFTNPLRYPERAKSRRNVVLQLMHRNGYIDAAEYAAAAQAPLGLSPAKNEDNDSAYFIALMNEELQQRVPDNSDTDSYQVYTTLDHDLQSAAVEAIRVGMPKVDKLVRQQSKDGALPQVALIAIDPKTGEVKAAVGGRDYGKSQLNHILSKRQPGSIFKPFVYAAALESSRFTPSTTVSDTPVRIVYGDQVYEPGNYHGGSHGDVTLRYALSKSLNLATVNLAQKVGYQKIVRLAKAAGLNDDIKATPSVALGSYETTPLEMAGAYTVFANEGVYVKPTFVRRIEAGDGRSVLSGSPEKHSALDPRIAFLMRDMLQEVMTSGTAAGVGRYGFRGAAAGKTGTSRDGWFAGFTPNLLCIVWVGFDDNRELDLEGAKSALPIWAEFMRRASAIMPDPGRFPAPPRGIVAVKVDPETGLLAGESCPTQRGSYFLHGTQPTETCTAHSQGFFKSILGALH